MGVAGLLKAVRKAGGTVQLSEYAGQKAGICGHSWLHQLGSWYAHEIVTMGVFDSVVRLFTDRCIALQQHHGICPVVVFDGASHPGKSGTDLERATRRIAAQTELEDVELAGGDRRRLEAMGLNSSCCQHCRLSSILTGSSGISRHSRPMRSWCT